MRVRINAHEGNMGVLIEDYKKRFILAVNSGDIRKRTKETKIQCLTLAIRKPPIPVLFGRWNNITVRDAA